MHGDISASKHALAGLRIAVTGAHGFIGRHLVSALQALDVETLLFCGDVRARGCWGEKFDVLFHLAAVTPHRFAENHGKGYDVNCNGTLQALDACRKFSGRIIFSSTCGVYDPLQGISASENCPIAPQTPYAQSKRIAELLCFAYASRYAVPTVILRLFNVYGIGQRQEFLTSYLVKCALEQREAIIRSPDAGRDFVHVQDVVHAFIRASMIKEPTGVFNIGSGKSYTVRNIIDMLSSELGKEVVWKKAQGSDEPRHAVCAAIDHAARVLGWEPRMSLEEGLRQMISSSGFASPQ